MNLKERKSTQMTVKVRNGAPTVHITSKALNKMFIYTEQVSDEVGWLGTAYRSGKHFLIDDVFLFDQQVHGTTTEITPEGLEKFGMELLSQEGGVDIWNNMKIWGHSHVNMGITPSGQDNKQMEDFSSIGHDFFIRLICNKKGELAVDVYDYEGEIEYHNVPWLERIEESDVFTVNAMKQIEEAEKIIAEMKAQIESAQKEKLDAIKEPIKEEIKVKVKKLVYQRPYTGTYNPTWNYGKKNGNQGLGIQQQDYRVANQIDGINSLVTDFFSQSELEDLAYTCYSWYAFDTKISNDPNYEFFTQADLNKIWSYIQNLRQKGYNY